MSLSLKNNKPAGRDCGNDGTAAAADRGGLGKCGGNDGPGRTIPNLLLIDSTKPELTVAVSAGGVILDTQISDEQRRHDKNINGLVKTALLNAGLKLNDLSAVAAVTGAGSWTGIRVGLAVVKAYSYALKIPIIELTGQIDLTAAVGKYNRRNFADAFTVKPFYNGEFIVRTPQKT